MIPATSIWLNRAEGPTALCGERLFEEGDLWEQANGQMFHWSLTAPDLGCDKVDFLVTYADGYQYHGRVDMTRTEYRVDQHIRESVSFLAGDTERAVLARRFAELDQQQFIDFLATYEIGSPPEIPEGACRTATPCEWCDTVETFHDSGPDFADTEMCSGCGRTANWSRSG